MNNWYATARVSLHIDNHSKIIGRDMSAEDLTAMFSTYNVDIIQVSAMGNQGTELTFPSTQLPHLVHPDLNDYDMIEHFRRAVRACSKRFFIYINTRGLRICAQHPDWMQIDAEGKGSDFRGGNDACARPTLQGDGFLEKELIPLLEELTERYDPDGYWIDGDHARIPACYCKNCRDAWRAYGGAEAPKDTGSPEWSRWLEFQHERKDAYRQMMADAVHRIKPEALYCSNHSWRNTYTAASRNIDPRSAPDWIGYISADLSHGDAVRQTRLMAMNLSAETETPHDIMHLVATRVSPQRFLQQGAITLASGSVWNLWGGQSFVDMPGDRANVETCLSFVDERDKGIGPTESANLIGVVASETAWAKAYTQNTHLAEAERANTTAIALQDAGYPVDIINERILTSDSSQYRLLITPEPSEMGEHASEVLERKKSEGIVVTNLPNSAFPEPDWDGSNSTR